MTTQPQGQSVSPDAPAGSKRLPPQLHHSKTPQLPLLPTPLANPRPFCFQCPRPMTYRAWLILALAAAMPGRLLAKLESAEVSLDYVAKKAEQRAHKPFHSPRAPRST